ncbi:hypothetical protein E2C01_026608 [Portunus trituberculatus]|uniref:Uncharacterized protein n=1 Tax=Portunus trituberculatus TaxID=210409 RepID=A0A5B7EJM7_PORTR|nr:hypothetical protein [Portunus trituberculatus]
MALGLDRREGVRGEGGTPDKTLEYSNSIKLRLARYSGHWCCFICIPRRCTVIGGKKGKKKGNIVKGEAEGEAGDGNACVGAGEGRRRRRPSACPPCHLPAGGVGVRVMVMVMVRSSVFFLLLSALTSVPSASACSSRPLCLNFISPKCMTAAVTLYTFSLSSLLKPSTSKASCSRVSLLPALMKAAVEGGKSDA